MSWAPIIGLAAAAYACKAIGLFGLSRASLGASARQLVSLLPAALLAALVVAQTFGSGDLTDVWTRAVGVAVGAAVAWRRAPLMIVLVAAAATSAVLRLVVG